MFFKEEFLEKCFANKDMQTIPCSCQSIALHSIEDILEEIVKENPYVQLSELFTVPESDEQLPTESLQS